MSRATVVDAIHKQGITKMSFEDRKAVEQEVKELDEQLKKATDPGNGTSAKPDMLQNAPALRQRKKQLEDLLNKDDDLIATGADRQRLAARAKEIEAIVKKEIPSEREQKLMPRHEDFERAVQKQMAHQKKYGPLLVEWQEIMKRLDPENPEACDTRRLWR